MCAKPKKDNCTIFFFGSCCITRQLFTTPQTRMLQDRKLPIIYNTRFSAIWTEERNDFRVVSRRLLRTLVVVRLSPDTSFCNADVRNLGRGTPDQLSPIWYESFIETQASPTQYDYSEARSYFPRTPFTKKSTEHTTQSLCDIAPAPALAPAAPLALLLAFLFSPPSAFSPLGSSGTRACV